MSKSVSPHRSPPKAHVSASPDEFSSMAADWLASPCRGCEHVGRDKNMDEPCCSCPKIPGANGMSLKSVAGKMAGLRRCDSERVRAANEKFEPILVAALPLYKNGLGWREIGAAVGATELTGLVCRFYRRYPGIPKRNRGPKKQEKNQ